MNDEVVALKAAGSSLFVGGLFYNAGGTPNPNDADSLAEWSGSAWSAVGSTNDAFGTNTVKAIAVDGDDIYVGGTFPSVSGVVGGSRIPMWDDSSSSWDALGSGLNATVRAIAISGDDVFIGGDFTNQKVERSAARGRKITFQVSIQNDSLTATDEFKVDASGAASSHYTVRYLKGSQDITTNVENGDYETTALAPGAAHVIKVEIEVGPNAPANSKVTRKLTLTSVDDPTRHDAVKVVGKRS